MQKLGAVAAIILALASALYATDSSADESMATKAAPAQTEPAACNSLWDFFNTSCPLSWYGITVYGVVDGGVTWISHGARFNGTSTTGQDYIVSKEGNHSLWGVAPNALSQSTIGIKGNEQIVPGWSLVFALDAGFDPYSFQLANAPHSVLESAGVPLNEQESHTSSSRAGQFFNGQGFFGVSSPIYGTLTIFRQNTLTLDGVLAYDPMGGSYAFSPIGYQGTTCGAGDTEDCRLSTALKYRVNVGQFRVGALWQFGGYSQNNAANGAYQLEGGLDVHNLAGGTLSLDAIGSYVKDPRRSRLPATPCRRCCRRFSPLRSPTTPA
jgi:predicted porin